MIYGLQGEIDAVKEGFFVVRAGGVFYKVYAGARSLGRASEATESVRVYTSSYIKDENTPELYGFFHEEELIFFELLVGVSGVGRKTALKILDGGTVEEVSAAIVEKDMKFFSRVPGIGKKTADRIVLELGEKMAVVGSKETVERMSADAEVVDVLVQLGFPREKVKKTLEELGSEPKRLEERIKKVLLLMGKK